MVTGASSGSADSASVLRCSTGWSVIARCLSAATMSCTNPIRNHARDEADATHLAPSRSDPKRACDGTLRRDNAAYRSIELGCVPLTLAVGLSHFNPVGGHTGAKSLPR